MKHRELRILPTAGPGWNIRCNGVEAIALVKSKPVDILLVEWNLPDLVGVSFIELVRKFDANVKIIMVTGEAEKHRVISALDAGANSYVIKPFATNVLIERLHQVVDAPAKQPTEQSAAGVPQGQAGLRAADIMTSKVVTVAASASLAEAAQLLMNHSISGLPVCGESGQLVGVVTEKDLLVAQDMMVAEATPVKTVMSSPPIAVEPDALVGELINLFADKSFRRVPVVRHGKVVGVVSRRDMLCRVLAKEPARSVS